MQNLAYTGEVLFNRHMYVSERWPLDIWNLEFVEASLPPMGIVAGKGWVFLFELVPLKLFARNRTDMAREDYQ